MEITLTQKEIDAALPKIKEGLNQYTQIQAKLFENINNAKNPGFRKQFNHFYRIRRKPEWQEKYYTLFIKAGKEKLNFNQILTQLKDSTGRVEASFASKLLASLKPDLPIIDSVVLKNLKMPLPYSKDPNRIQKITEIYENLQKYFSIFLTSENGQYLIESFKKKYPDSKITKTKILDLALWQTRD